MIKLIVSDLDGTLLKYDNEFDYESYQKIKELEKKGIELMFATGRDYWMVEDICQKYDIYNPMILNNGTQYRTYNGEVNHYYPMERDAFEKVMNILMSYHYHISVHTQKGKYIFEDIEKYFSRHVELLKKARGVDDESQLPKAAFFTREGYLKNVHEVQSIDDLYLQGALPLKIDARHIDAKYVSNVRHLFDDIEHLHISSSFGENIEITSDIHDKGSMLKEVLKQRGLSIEEVATFGDGLNDISLLDFPYSFAPGNAVQEAKQKATYSLNKTCEQGAVKKGLEILEKLNLL